MNKNIFVWIIAFLVLMSSVSALDTNNFIQYLSFDDVLTFDSANNKNATNDGCYSSIGGAFGTNKSTCGSTEHIDTQINSQWNGLDDFGIGFHINYTAGVNPYFAFEDADGSRIEIQFDQTINNDMRAYIKNGGTIVTKGQTGAIGWGDGDLHFFAFVRRANGDFFIYKDGVKQAHSNDTASAIALNSYTKTYWLTGNNKASGVSEQSAHIDEFWIYDGVLTDADILSLNSSNPFSGSPPPTPTSYFDITAIDNQTSNPINTFNATIDLNNGTLGLFFSTTNGTINTGINQSVALLGNVTFRSNNYFEQVYLNHNISNDLQSILLDYPKITTFDNESSNSINTFNVSLVGGFWNTTTGTINFPYQTTKTITIKSQGYNDKAITFNFENGTDLNTALLYTYARMYIQGFEAPLNTTQILNLTIIAESLNSSFSLNSSTTNGLLNVSYPRGETINATFDNDEYALTSNLIFPSYNYFFNFSAYPTNSVFLFIRDSETNALINTSRINITLNGAAFYSVFTLNGTYRFKDIKSGNYQADLEAGSYSDNTYFFALNNRTHRELDWYMSSTCTDITFSFLDTYQSALEGVVATFNQQVNGSWVNVGQKTTDISGDIQICLETEKHLIQAVKSGYQTWEGNLTPLTTEYTIFLDILGARVYNLLFDDITFIYSPTTSTLNGNLTNITFTTYSPGGEILYFGLNTTYNGTQYIHNITTSASGGVASVELPLKQDDDSEFSVDFFVKSVSGNYHHFKIYYNVFDFAISQYSLVQIFDDWETQEGTFAVLFWVYVMILFALGLIHLAGGRGIVLVISAILLIGIFSSPLIAVIDLTIGIIQTVVLILISIAMSKRGLL